MCDVFSINDSDLLKMEVPASNVQDKNALRAVLKNSTQNQASTQREIQRNLLRNALLKIKEIAAQTNLNLFEPHTLQLLLIMNLKIIDREELLLRYIETLQAEEGQPPLRDTFDVESISKVQSYCRESFNTCLDWHTFLSFFEVHDAYSNELTRKFELALQHAQVTAGICPVQGILHTMIDNISSTKMLERMFTNYDNGMAYLEMKAMKVITCFHDSKWQSRAEADAMIEMVSTLRVSKHFFTSMNHLIRERTMAAQEDMTSRRPSRLRLRFAAQGRKLQASAEYDCATSTFQAWVVQRRFSVVSSRHMQLMLYFITVQPRNDTDTPAVPLQLYASRYPDTIIKTMHEHQAVHRIDFQAISELMSSVRTYTHIIPNMVDFETNVLSNLSDTTRFSLSRLTRFLLYVACFQHNSIAVNLWKTILPVYNHSIQAGIREFKLQQKCHYESVLANMFTVHEQNINFEQRYKSMTQ